MGTDLREIVLAFTGGAQGTAAETTTVAARVFGQQVTTEANGLTATVTAIPVFDYGMGAGGGVSNPVLRSNTNSTNVYAATATNVGTHSDSKVRLAVNAEQFGVWGVNFGTGGTISQLNLIGALAAGTVTVPAATAQVTAATIASPTTEDGGVTAVLVSDIGTAAGGGVSNPVIRSNTQSTNLYVATATNVGAESDSRARAAVWASQDGAWNVTANVNTIGSLPGVTVTGGTLAQLNAATINTGTIRAVQSAGWSISAATINTGTIRAVQSAGWSISAATVNTGTIRAVQSGAWTPIPQVTRDGEVTLMSTTIATTGAATSNVTSSGSATLTPTGRGWINLQIRLTASNDPSRIRFVPQGRVGGSFGDYDFGYFQALAFEDIEVTGGVTKNYQVPMVGDQFNIQVRGDGVNSTKRWQVVVVAQAQNVR